MGLLSKKEPKQPKEKKPKKKKGKDVEQMNPADQALMSSPLAEDSQLVQNIQSQEQPPVDQGIGQQMTAGTQQPLNQAVGQQPMQQPVAGAAPQAQQNAYVTENSWINESREYTDQSNMQQNTNATASGMADENVNDPNKERKRVPNKRYKYTIINAMGKKEKGNFDAESEDDVRNFLLSQDYKVLEVAERDKYDIDIGKTTLKAADLSFALTQLSTYLRAGIPLADSVKNLS